MRIKKLQQKAKDKRRRGEVSVDFESFPELIQKSLPDCDPIIITYIRESIEAFKPSFSRVMRLLSQKSSRPI